MLPNPLLACCLCCVLFCLSVALFQCGSALWRLNHFPCSQVTLFFFLFLFSFLHKSKLPLFCYAGLLPLAPWAGDLPAFSHLLTQGFSALTPWPYWKAFRNIRMPCSGLLPFFHDRCISTWCSDNMWLVLVFLQTSSLSVDMRLCIQTILCLRTPAWSFESRSVISVLNMYFMIL